MIKRILPAVLTAVAVIGTLVYSTAQKPADAPPPAPPPYNHFQWKGNLHTHSLWSDGDDYPEMIADWYRTHGYQFLAFSEHNLLAEGDKWIPSESTPARKQATEKYAKRFGDAWLERRVEKNVPQVKLKPLRDYRKQFDEEGKFHLIPGEELTHSYSKRPVHMGVINLRDVLKPVDGASVEETIRVHARLVAEQQKKSGSPILSILNHPNWKWGVTAEDFAAVEELQYFEVLNGHPGVANYGDATHASTERMWDIILALRLGKLQLPMVYGVGTDDAHAYHEFGATKSNPGRAWCMVHAEKLAPENIVNSMKKGDFYFSTGVTILNIKKDKELIVEVKGEPGVTHKVEFIATMKGVSLESEPVKDNAGKEVPLVTRKYSPDIGKVVQTGGDIVGKQGPTFVYKFTGKELYVRAKITSDKAIANPYAKGDTAVAWTQPFTP